MKGLVQLIFALFLTSNVAFAVTVIKESRNNEDIKFVVRPSGVFTEAVVISGTTGNLVLTNSMNVPNGSAAVPSVAFTSDADGSGTGIYRVGANSLGFSANGTNIGQYSSAGAWTIGASGSSQTQTINGTNVTVKGGSTVNFNINSSASGNYSIISLQRNSTTDAQIGVVGTTGDFFTGESAGDLAIRTNTGGAIRFGIVGGGNQFGTMSNAGAWTLGGTVGSLTHTIQSGARTDINLKSGAVGNGLFLNMYRGATQDFAIGLAAQANDGVTGTAIGDTYFVAQGSNKNILFGKDTSNVVAKMDGSTGIWRFQNGINPNSSGGTAITNSTEGTCTPAFAPGTGSYTTTTYSSQSCTWVRIGRMVFIRFALTLSAFSVGTAGGQIHINLTGAPTNASSGDIQNLPVYFVENITQPANSVQGGAVTCSFLAANQCFLYTNRNASGASPAFDSTSLTSSSRINVSGTYITD